ncbi:MAG TPA: thiol:disulfide interchange protein DsbA/DsbL [Thermomonas sp.]|nr:thiol:disulfide interchange protein DsbA/DsbL [Thermomonas sp.]
MRATLLTPLLSAFLLLATAVTPAHAQRAALPGLTEGVDYKLIEGGKPYRAVPGKIEVAEVFAYWCSHCANFAPMLENWKRTLPKHAQLVLVPSALDKSDAYARFHFAADAAKAVPVLHPRLFKAIHETGELPRAAELAQIATYGARVPGVNAKALATALKDSKSLDAKMQHAYDFAVRSQIPGTPALVIDGRYLVLGNSYQRLLDNANRVIEALAPTAKPAAR